VDIDSGEICTCLSEALPIELPTGQKCCSPHGTIISQDSCCPIGVQQCCGLDVAECYGVVNPFALDFQLTVLGNLLKPGEKAGLASFQIDPKIAEAEIGTTHLATNMNSHSFEFNIVDIIVTGEEMISQAETPTVPQEWTDLMYTLQKVDDPELKAKQVTLVAEWQTPMDPKELQELQERNVLTKIIVADTTSLDSSSQLSRIEFVALIECFTDKKAVYSCSLMVLGDPADLLASPIDYMLSNSILVADCQSTYDALEAEAENTLCKGVTMFKSDPICVKKVTGCTIDQQSAKTLYEGDLIFAEVARAAAMAVEIAMKARKIAHATLTCSRLIIPWAAIACLNAALSLIEYQYYERKQLVEEIKSAATRVALKKYERGLAFPLEAMRGEVEKCW